MDTPRLVDVLGSWSDGRRPLYRRLAAGLEGAIRRGDLGIGARLPAERLLAQSLALSRSTVVNAYDLLEGDGWIVRKRGSGTSVAASARAAVPDRAALVGALGRNLPSPVRDDAIDLSSGAPLGAAEVAVEDLLLERADLAPLIEQRGYTPAGYAPLRQAIAARYRARGLPTHEDQILVTSGAQQAIMLLALLYVRSGDHVLIENPTYFGAIDAFRSSGARFAPIAVDAGGARTEGLRELAAAHAPRAIYTVPTLQNPTGAIMSEARRRELARIADDLHLPVIEDETLAELCFAPPPPPVAAFAKGGTVITVGSLSKLVWAGLRVGWLRAPSAVIERLLPLKAVSDLGSSLLAQAVAARACTRIEALRAQRCAPLPARLDTLLAALREHLPGWECVAPHGGFFAWVRLPHGDGREFAQLAVRHGVRVTPGSDMSVNGDAAHYLRLSYLAEPELIVPGVERLARAWDAYAPAARGARRPLEPVV